MGGKLTVLTHRCSSPELSWPLLHYASICILESASLSPGLLCYRDKCVGQARCPSFVRLPGEAPASRTRALLPSCGDRTASPEIVHEAHETWSCSLMVKGGLLPVPRTRGQEGAPNQAASFGKRRQAPRSCAPRGFHSQLQSRSPGWRGGGLGERPLPSSSRRWPEPTIRAGLRVRPLLPPDFSSKGLDPFHWGIHGGL